MKDYSNVVDELISFTTSLSKVAFCNMIFLFFPRFFFFFPCFDNYSKCENQSNRDMLQQN